MSDPVRLVYAGEILEGFEADAVKRAVGERLKLEGAQLDRLFTGKKVVVRREIERAKAEKMVARFQRHGASFRIEPIKAGASEGTPSQPVPLAPPPETPDVGGDTVADRNNPRTQVLEEVMCEACGQIQYLAERCELCGSPLGRRKAAPEPAEVPEPSAPAPDSGAGAGPASILMPPTPEMLAELERSRLSLAAQPDWNQFESPSFFNLSPRGRMGRVYFGIGTLLGVGALMWLGLGLLLMPYWPVLYAATAVAALVGVWFLRLLVLRLHDLGWRAWWAALVLVPGLNLALVPLLMLLPGQKVFNRFGHPPMASNALIGIAAVLLLAFDTVTIGTLAVDPTHRQEFRFDQWPPIALRDVNLETRSVQAPELPSDEELLTKLVSPSAVKDFKDGYWPAPAHRAFAWSPDGAHAWSGGAEGGTVASERALADCRKLRRPYTQDCRVVHVDNIWTFKSAR